MSIKNNIILSLFLIGCAFTVKAQLYGNEWINYNQTYFKFAVAKDSLYRIPISQLVNAGLPTTVVGSNLQLFKDGVEVPIFVSQNGTLTSNDYIDFWGEKAKGNLDKRLYQNSNLQLNPELNLVSDTAFYFVTYNTLSNNKRYNLRNNDLTNVPIKEEYFWDKIRIDYRNEFVAGTSSSAGNSSSGTTYYNLNSSQYEEEGYVKKTVTVSDSVLITCTNPYKVAGGPSGFFKSAVAGKSYLNTHGIKIYANSNQIADSTYGSFAFKRFDLQIPMSYVNAQNRVYFRYTPYLSSGTYLDRYGISYLEFKYPRLFDFNNQKSFKFELAPKTGNYYLEITNFDHGNISPRLYDLSSNEFIQGDISIAGKVRFVIPGNNQIKQFVLQNISSNVSVANISSLSPITFKNYSINTNQGNYIIISHPALINPGTSSNYLADYNAYRNSIVGGNYNSIVANVNDIYNEFGYGYSFSTLAIKNFLHYAHANSQWTNRPKYVFLVGKGFDYNNYLLYSTANATSPGTYPYKPIPSFGNPCSDWMLTDFNKTNIPQIPIGRLPAFNNDDIKIYLDKVKDYESELTNVSNQTSAAKLWQKRILHIAGGKNANEQAPIAGSLLTQENIIKKPYYGAQVTTIKKSSTSSIDFINSTTIDNLVNNGVGLIQFYGHSSANDIDYNLGDPNLYSNYKKYPVFIANGCNAGNMFALNAQKYLSEKWVLSPNAGAIAFLASVNTGFTSSLGQYTDSLYAEIGYSSYGKSIGEQVRNNIQKLMNTPSFGNDFLDVMHSQQIQLDGDPAIQMYSFSKPDYAIEEQGIQFQQVNLTTALDSFDVNVIVNSLGKYLIDSVRINIKRILPNGTSSTVFNQKVIGFSNNDTISLRLPIMGNAGLGKNQLVTSIDEESFIDEITKSNNLNTFEFNIFNEDLVPVYPYDFSIVSNQALTLKGSTLNAFSPEKDYVFQIDTTEKFNSPLLKMQHVIQKGGVIKWQPGITMLDSTVYYWRTAMDTIYGNKVHRWTQSSFVYLPQSSPGWNQSHYFQFAKNKYSKIYIDSNSRAFKFENLNRTLQVNNACLYGPNPFQYLAADYSVNINGSSLFGHGCNIYPLLRSLQFVVIDSFNGTPWRNANIGGVGRFGSYAPCQSSSGFTDPYFEFNFATAAGRTKIMNFLDSIPNGFYVMMQTRVSCKGYISSQSNTIFINDWKKDTLVNGAGNSLYHKLYNLGFTEIDSFTKNRPLVFFQQKNRPNTIQQHVGIDSTVRLQVAFNYTSTEFEGEIATDKIGPAKSWTDYIKGGSSLDANVGDSVSVDIYGIDKNEVSTLLSTVIGDTSLAFINAAQFPYLQLKMHSKDNNYATPEQLKKWRIHYQPVPEAALNPNMYYSFFDTLGQGQIKRFNVGFENLTDIPMDSMLVQYHMIDNKNNKTLLGVQRYRPMAAFDSVYAHFDVNTANFSGNNVLMVEINPDNDQIEQFHPNNIGLKDIKIIADNTNPLIDVTFDGIHILDKDIVSCKPYINILLKDENKYLALNDTSLLEVYLKYPGDNLTQVRMPFDGTIMKFIPADLLNSTKNQARIEFRPTFTIDGNDYVLIVKAKDRAGNIAGTNDYKIGFTIANKPSISALVNYPNPFTTSTQFVFTLTGSEIPSQLKIQILTPTGKVVREITKEELGNIHIGRNITDFKWKGDDQFGQPLGNGVYLYRFISSLHGNKIDNFTSGADKWTEKGFGKLYIMR